MSQSNIVAAGGKATGRPPGITGARPALVLSAAVSGLVGHQGRRAADLLPDFYLVIRLAQEAEADDDADRGDRHRVEQTAERNAGQGRDRGAGGRYQPAEHAVA